MNSKESQYNLKISVEVYISTNDFDVCDFTKSLKRTCNICTTSLFICFNSVFSRLMLKVVSSFIPTL